MTALALAAQEAALHTPDTTAYMRAAYLVIGAIWALYAASLCSRLRKAKEE